MVRADACIASPTREPDWNRIARHLARRALRWRGRLPAAEIHSLAGLAVAEALARYDGNQATCSQGMWATHCGWLILQTLIRDERRRRRQEPSTVSFTDISARFAHGSDDGGEGALQRILAPRTGCRRDIEWVEQLDDQERLLTQLRLAGASLEDIAEKFGRSRHWVRWRLKELRHHVARLLGEPDLEDWLPPTSDTPPQPQAPETDR